MDKPRGPITYAVSNGADVFPSWGTVKVIQLLCAGFSVGVVFMAAMEHFHIGTVCAQ